MLTHKARTQQASGYLKASRYGRGMFVEEYDAIQCWIEKIEVHNFFKLSSSRLPIYYPYAQSLIPFPLINHSQLNT